MSQCSRAYTWRGGKLLEGGLADIWHMLEDSNICKARLRHPRAPGVNPNPKGGGKSGKSEQSADKAELEDRLEPS